MKQPCLFFLYIYVCVCVCICVEFYLFIFGCAGSSLLCRLFLQLYAGCSLQWLLSLERVGSRCAGLSSCGTWAQWSWLTGSRAQVQLLPSMWGLSGPGVKSLSPLLAPHCLLLSQQGSPMLFFSYILLLHRLYTSQSIVTFALNNSFREMRGSLILPTYLLFLVFFISLWKSRFPFVTILPSEGLLTVLWCRSAITHSLSSQSLFCLKDYFIQTH